MISNDKLNIEAFEGLTPKELAMFNKVFSQLTATDFVINEERPCCLYLHLNKVNRKKYFGITTQKVAKRWKNGSTYSTNKHFYSSIQSYGWDSFYHIVLCKSLTIESAKKLEKILINVFNTTNPLYGYNKTIGGESGCKYYTIEEATIARKETFLKSAKKRYADPEKRKDIIKASTNYQNKVRKIPEILEKKKAMQRASKQKVKVVRDLLRQLYIESPNLFTEEVVSKAFGFKEDNKTYLCQSAKELTKLLDQVKGGAKYDK